MYEPWDGHIPTQQEGISSQVTLWKDRSSAAMALNIPNALVISVSGTLEHRHFVEVCAFAGRRWRPAQERLILDFTKMKAAESAGIRYVANQLHATANQSGGTVFFVKIPPTAKAFLDKTWGSEHIHFVHSLKHAISAAIPVGDGTGFMPGNQTGLKKKKRRIRRTGSPKISRDFPVGGRRRGW
jgi:anti-anti-sigma regulatory factor